MTGISVRKIVSALAALTAMWVAAGAPVYGGP